MQFIQFIAMLHDYVWIVYLLGLRIFYGFDKLIIYRTARVIILYPWLELFLLLVSRVINQK